ncbi:winged helix-turn-helix domain-containing protein [Gilvimarinus sp. SDUM040013]|uniref:Winged helix-turn-helix domain-containing protein n=1 Tax=Gilvimarinus gilvus TaxID=3058038 RepID=A0ABU4RZ97_9GAMM|nr:winged helix-turn-helix domain-containing protein [Gilvimarinus sp. SDUM040013]MDO3384612.1 winged helix-turn-helix domain-containing protein [Gilvimarinus sp. SDUM040013]MDX6850198.1 winged helix-turn-helix domain-containing protein [Gilvimarinus sp. SDUM040013]
MKGDDSTAFRIGDITVYPARNELCTKASTASVQPKVMAVLSYLSEQHPRVVSTDELMDKVWSGRVVTQSSVQKSMTFLRKAIAALVGDQIYIEHHSKKGYQLIRKPEWLRDAYQPNTSSLWRNLANLLASKVVFSGLILALVGALLITYGFAHKDRWLWGVSHSTQFTAGSTLSLNVDKVAEVVPHPRKDYIALIGVTGSQHQVLVRNSNGDIWSIARSARRWSLLQWSPDGRYLAVVERDSLGAKGVPLFGSQASLLTLHVYELDLENRVLLDKHRLSDWYGDIYSVTWWQEGVLEFVARSGSKAVRNRYRYALATQNLQQVRALEFSVNPINSQVHQSFTALLTPAEPGLQLDFLNEDQQRFQSFQIDASAAEISWLPDASGVLVTKNHRDWKIYYRDGTVKTVKKPDTDRALSSAHFEEDGDSLVYLGTSMTDQLWLQDSSRVSLLEKKGHIDQVLPDIGESALILVRHHQDTAQILKVLTDNKNSETLDSRATILYERDGASLENLNWQVPGQTLTFNVGADVFTMQLASGLVEKLTSARGVGRAWSVSSDSKDMIFERRHMNVKNLWRYIADDKGWTQVTFGDVASTVGMSGVVYYQNVDQPGVWRLNADGPSQRLLAEQLPANSKLLAIKAEYLYFTVGVQCSESDIMRVNINTGELVRLQPEVPDSETLAYHPDMGRIYTPCLEAEAEVSTLIANSH